MASDQPENPSRESAAAATADGWPSRIASAAAPVRRGESVAGVEQAEGPGAPEPGEDVPGLSLVQDAHELGGDPLARQRGIRGKAQRERLRSHRGPVVSEAEAGGVPRGTEDARRILDVGERVESTQTAPRQVEAPAERIDQVERPRG